MECVYFSTVTCGPVKILLTEDGRIDFSVLAAVFGLESDSITLCGTGVPRGDLPSSLSRSSWREMKSFFSAKGTEEDPIIVDGRAVPEPSGESGLSSEDSKVLRELGLFAADTHARRNSTKSIAISGVARTFWNTLEKDEGLQIRLAVQAYKPMHVSTLPPFGWDDRLEKAQADRYIPHINKIKKGRDWVVLDAANSHPTLLSGPFGGWSFRGTTDVAITHRKALSVNPARGLRCIFELKKDRTNCGESQALIGLVMANIISKQFRPFAVLTDLVDSWTLYWMDGSTIVVVPFESRATAVGYIEDLLEDSEGTTIPGVGPFLRLQDLQVTPPLKRRMYEPPEMENLVDLVGFIPDEEILSAQVAVGLQQLQPLLQVPIVAGGMARHVHLGADHFI